MKFLLIILTIINTGCVLANPSKVKFTIKATDAETGLNITNGVCEHYFQESYDPWGGRPDKVTKVNVSLNSKGCAILEGRSIKNFGMGAVVIAKGYYTGHNGRKYDHLNVALNRWEPWNPTITVKLRPKKDPVPMVHKVLALTAPVFNKPVGLDLEVGDWVAPYGKGKIADFVVMFNFLNPKEKGIHYSLTFSNPDDGIQEYEFPKNLDSSFKWLYLAPLSGYQSSLDKYSVLRFPIVKDAPKYNLKEKVNYIFRVRSRRNKKGEIISACYGKIRGEIKISLSKKFRMGYWFNPNPKSRSLESKNKPY